MSLLELLRSPANRNLLDILIKLPQLGVGSRVTRKSWEPYGDSYWDLTQVKPRKPDGRAGKIWGVLTWRGEQAQEERMINGRAKKVWRWVPSEQQAALLQPLVKELDQLRAWRRLAEKQAAQKAAGSSEAAS